MKAVGNLILKAVIILIACGLLGMGVNVVSPKGIPWIYVPARTIDLAGIKTQLINEKEAQEFYGDSQTVFIDARNREDYERSHVQGAVFLAPEDVEERFVSVQALLPEEARIVLYC